MDSQPRSWGQTRRHDAPPRKLRKGIKRVRTGCQTCKKRGKKCDEARPYCQNCARGNYQCPGFPVARIWEETPPGMRAARSRSRTAPQPVRQSSWTDMSCSPPSENEFLSLDSLQFFGSVPAWSDGISTTGQSPPMDISLSHVVPYELPPLVIGSRYELRDELFCHFLQDMSRVLTASSHFELVEVIKPYAESDGTVMSALLCLAASHLLNTGTQENRRLSIRLERDYLYREARYTLQHHMTALRTQQLSLGNESLPFVKLENVFLSCLLLCLYEICEGNVDDTSVHHLSTAREVLLMSLQTAGHPIIRGTAMNPIFVQFFVYHEALAAVTLSSALPTNSHFYSTVRSPYHGPFAVDLHDGFSDLAFRISALRPQARISTDLETLSKEAKELENDIHGWGRTAGGASEATLIKRLYKNALYVWLFVIWYSLISHDTVRITVIQHLVKTTIADISQIAHNDPVLTALLFPLFIIGGAANDSEDRTAVRKQFQKLKKWTCFGNVDRALSVVEEMWKNHDSGSLESWDWVLQLQTHNMTLLVT